MRTLEEAGITVTLPKPMTSNAKAEGRPCVHAAATTPARACPWPASSPAGGGLTAIDPLNEAPHPILPQITQILWPESKQAMRFYTGWVKGRSGRSFGQSPLFPQLCCKTLFGRARKIF